MGNVFSDAMDVMEEDENLGVSILYQPADGDAVTCRAIFEDEDDETPLRFGRDRERVRKRILLVSVAKVPAPLKADTVEVPVGGATFRVFDFSRDDIETARWRLELTDTL